MSLARRHRGLALALAVGAAGLALQLARHREEIGRYDRQQLPAFDAYVYMAMADAPSVFTLAPWGRRLLTPALASALGLTDTADAFGVVTFAALLLSAGLLFLFLRRLGFGEGGALLGVAAFVASGPVAETVSYLILSDPLAALLELALLLALEAGAGAGALALVAALGALNKETLLLSLPIVYLARRERDGDRRALRTAALAAAPALLLAWELRRWTDYLPEAPSRLPASETLWLGAYRILAAFPDWWGQVLLGALVAPAALGALLRPARPLLRRYGYLLALTLALPFAASVYTDDSRNVPFFVDDIPRLLLLALPLTIPLALHALAALWPGALERSEAVPAGPDAAAAAPPAGARDGRVPGALAGGFALALVAVLPWTLDTYRRADLRGPRDGRLLLALCRESLGFARRLERGRPVAYDPEARRFSPGRSDPHLLERMRWYLREGWGPMPHYAMGPVVMQAPAATLVLPCLGPAELEVSLSLSAPGPARLRVEANGQPVGELAVAPEPASHTLRIPAAALYRGDNLLRLTSEDGAAPEVRLHQMLVRRAGGA